MVRAEKEQEQEKNGEQEVTFAGILRKVLELEKVVQKDLEALRREAGMAKANNVFSMGDVARICNVASRTACIWFDKGLLKGYRIPGSRDRRVSVRELKRFMKTHNMPLDAFTAEYEQ